MQAPKHSYLLSRFFNNEQKQILTKIKFTLNTNQAGSIDNINQVNLIITLSLGSMETDRVIGESCYNEVIYNRHIA